MAPGTLFGLVAVGAGLLVLVISRPLASRAAIMRTWFSASADIPWWTQRGTLRIRLIAASWILLGIGIAIYGLITGRREGLPFVVEEVPVALRPPVALAKAVESIPRADAMPGGCWFEPKWDGYLH